MKFNFYEEVPAEGQQDKVETPPVPDEPAKAHILTPEEMEAWKNGGAGEESVLRHRADIEEETDKDDKTAEASTTSPKVAENEEEPLVPAAFTPKYEDPGEFVPDETSFEVTIYDAEGKNGRVVTLKSVAELDDLIEKDSNFGSYAALRKAEKAADRVERKIEAEQTKWQEQKKLFDDEQQNMASQVERLNSYSAEMDYLMAKGELPKISAELKNADWKDPKIAAADGVKEQIAVLKYMDKENVLLAKAGLPQMTVISAYNAMQLENAKKGQQDTKVRTQAARKAASARVGGSSPAQATGAPKGIAVGRVSPGGLRDMGVRF